MPGIHILYEADHQNRAAKLASVIPGATSGLVSSPPRCIGTGLDTLIFWGHGTFVNLCGKTSAELAALIKDWRRLNPGLNSVELITCNARHFSGNADSYANQLKATLRSGVLSSTRNVKVLALPVAVGGIRNACSILLADWQSGTWVYVTAPGPNDTELMKASNLIVYNHVGGRATSRRPDGTDIASLANKLVVENPRRNWSMLYGTFGYLRKNLVAV